MAYEFTEWEQEPEPQASSGHSVVPPRTITGVGVLDPSVPPKKPPSALLRILAALVLVGFVVLIGSMFFLRHH
jgi:hypothetical protein